MILDKWLGINWCQCCDKPKAVYKTTAFKKSVCLDCVDHMLFMEYVVRSCKAHGVNPVTPEEYNYISYFYWWKGQEEVKMKKYDMTPTQCLWPYDKLTS